VRDPRQLHPRLVTGRLDAEPGKNPCDRPCEHYWDRQPQGSTKQRRVNLSGDDDIRNQRERGGNQHGPLAWVVGIGDCDLIHGVEVTGACRGSLSTDRAARVAIPRRRTGAPKLEPERYREAVPNGRVARRLFRVDAGPRTGLLAPCSSSCGPILGATAGSSRSASKLQSALDSVFRHTECCEGTRQSGPAPDPGTAPFQFPRRLSPSSSDHRRSGPRGCVAPCLEGRRRSFAPRAGAPSVGACPPRRLENSVLST
jgi:hypothetical protein